MLVDIDLTSVTPVSPSSGGKEHGAGVAVHMPAVAYASSRREGADDMAGEGGSPPPNGEAMIAALVGEVERLRHEADLARHYETFLGEEADRHSILPVLNRRALLRAVNQLQLASEQVAIGGALLYLHVGGINRLRRRHGLAASDQALSMMVSLMHAQLRQTDLIGYLDGGDFAVTLAPCDDIAAKNKALCLAQSMSSHPLVWQDATIHFSVNFGLAPLDAALSAEETLAAADLACRQTFDLQE